MAFLHHVFGRAAALPAAHVGNYAICTEIITAVHNIQPGVCAARSEHGRIFTDFGSGARVDKHAPFTAVTDFFDTFSQFIQIISAENDIDERELLRHGFSGGILLGHTAHNRDYKIRIIPLEYFCGADIAFCTAFRIVSDTTSIE